MAPKKKSDGILGVEDNLSGVIADSLKKVDVPTYTIGKEETPTDLKDFISTGSSLLDLAISNRPNAGIPVGRITELSGLEGSGKSLVCAHMIANIQREGGVAVMYDTETAVNEEFYKAVGVDFDSLVYAHTNNLESIFLSIQTLIEKVRQSGKETKVLIIIDSIAGAQSIKDLDAPDYEKKGFGTNKSRLLSDALPKIAAMVAKQKIALVFTNQLRQNLNAGPFSDPYLTTGGKALPFYSSVRVRLSNAGLIKNKEKNVVGATVQAKIVKNRLGPPQRTVKFDVYYDRGIDDISSWITYLKEKGIIEGSNGNYRYYALETGEEFKFQTATWKKFIEDNPVIFEEIYNRMAEATVMSYSSDGISTADGSAEVVDVVTDE